MRLTDAPNAGECRCVNHRNPLCSHRASPHALRRRQRRIDDALVAGAAARDSRTSASRTSLSVGSGLLAQELGQRHQHARRAEAALQAVVVLERLLQRVQLAVRRRATRRWRLPRRRTAPASMRQARALVAVRRSTVHAPQTPCSQPTCVPVRLQLVAQEVHERECASPPCARASSRSPLRLIVRRISRALSLRAPPPAPARAAGEHARDSLRYAAVT